MRVLLGLLLPGQRRGMVTVFEDYDGSVKLDSKPIRTYRTKHVDIRDHRCVRETKDTEIVKIVHVSYRDTVVRSITRLCCIYMVSIEYAWCQSRAPTIRNLIMQPT